MCEKSFTRENLDQLIKDLLGITEVPFQIKRQIREYMTERGYTYKGIARALCFLIEQRHFNFQNSYQQYGIGIVKNVYQEAQTYYEKLRILKEKEEQRQKEIIATMTQETIKIHCGRADVTKQKKKKQIDISKL